MPLPDEAAGGNSVAMTSGDGANGGGGGGGGGGRGHHQGAGKLPRKRFYRARAHSNPLSDSHFPIPISPDEVDLSQHYPRYFPAGEGESRDGDAAAPRIRFADVGCGFGGLLVGLSTLFPDTLMIGMELRDKVTEYVKERILALRASNSGMYDNISVVRTNSMKYIPNYFRRAQLLKMFFLFPDPHFKEKNHRRRVISMQLLDEYAYVMEVGVIPEELLKADPVVKLLSTATEEADHTIARIFPLQAKAINFQNKRRESEERRTSRTRVSEEV
ncbi:hypothetical protein GUJ93_ZPchr0006g46241 [Zizania palustris]|uniref:tRNA (guanine-N(7)-)-methyltransferase n=1 Tax=Zizania palustris TaxID=103762 RepID=A0A8J5TCG1_ZIZPA|nr:hypothetical protein GUJ93_ZPchr0006g46241 [Zizania palustris]